MAVKRQYDSTRRRLQAEQTKRDIQDAARRLFVRAGIAATTIDAIADEAGVSAATVYSAFGTKRALVLSLSEVAQEHVELEARRREMFEERDPVRRIRLGVRLSHSFPRSRLDIAAFLSAARGVDPDLDAFVERGMQAHRLGAGRVVESLATEGHLREGLDVKEAADFYAAVLWVDNYRLFTETYGWDPDRLEDFLSEILARVLLKRPPRRRT
jgi:AcrR family transcriptional regulator